LASADRICSESTFWKGNENRLGKSISKKRSKSPLSIFRVLR
jgi:hypothetical protein